MSEWKEKPLSDLAILCNDSWKVGDEECSYIALENIEEGKLRLSGIGHSGIVTSNKYRFNEKNFLFGKLRPYFRKVVRPQFNGICSTDIWVVSARGETDLTFLFYLFANQEFVDLAYSGSSGTKMPRADWNFMKNTVWFIPSNIEEQRAIASVLSSLDDKIDLLHRQNQTLEAMAETLFRQWFVEEAEGGWEGCTLNDLCTQIASGGTPSTKIESYYNGNIDWYSTKELKDNFLYESENKITNEGLENSSAKLFPAGTVVIAIYAAPTVGRLGILANEASFNQAACGFIANEELCCSEFIYLHLKNQRDELNLMASGSAQQNLNVGKIKSYPAFKVPKDLMNKFKDAIQPNFKKINGNTLQIRNLEKLRDTLLPKLMSGEVRVEI